MNKNNFEFKVGDIVEHVLYNGEFELKEGESSEFPLLIELQDNEQDSIYRSFTMQGKEYAQHDKPSIKLIRRPMKMKEVEVVIIGNIYKDRFNPHETEDNAIGSQGSECLNPDCKKLIVKYFVKDEQ